jgi:hypothetical protein
MTSAVTGNVRPVSPRPIRLRPDAEPPIGAARLSSALGALTSRVVIERAKGVIAERAGIDLAEAFSRLRAYARSNNLRLTDVAQAAVDGTLDPRA